MADSQRSLAVPLLAAAVIASTAFAGWLYMQNRDLRADLSALKQKQSTIESEGAPAEAATEDGDSGKVVRKGPRTRSLFEGLARASRERPALEEQEKESHEQRRLRRRDEIRAFLGRGENESVEDYRERLAPLVEGGLAAPRARMADLRKELEEAAEVTDEQREELDQLFEDASREALELTNAAIANGDLTPYDTNWSGALSVAGGLGSILDGAEGRIDSILSPEQLAMFRDRGFVWGEYIGVNVPWEQLDPPPPGGD